MTQHFDIAVLGSGPGGYIAALQAAQQGATTAVVEQHPFFGGTCLNWGCIPSKAILATSELIHKLNEQAGEMGITLQGQVTHDWPQIQKRKDKILRGLRGGIKSLFAARKVEAFQGRGVLEGPGKIAVLDAQGQKIAGFTAGKVIVATGSTPAKIPGWPFDGDRVCTSDEALHWKELPARLIIVGGGVIGCEFACMMQPLGVKVDIVEMMPELLPGLDDDLATGLNKILKKRGIGLHLDVKVEELKVEGSVKARLSNGKTLEADRVLVSTGRRPATADLGLEAAGIQIERGFVTVNDSMMTTLADHYCIGDANGRMMLAHAASAHGITAVRHALGEPVVFDKPIPTCVYTYPEVAGVGMTEAGARRRNLPVRIGQFPLGHLGKAMAAGDTEGFVKVIRHRETDELLGIHMMGHNVTEVIAAAGNLLHMKATGHEVAEMIYAHPTISEGLGEAVHDSFGHALHLPPKAIVRVNAGL